MTPLQGNGLHNMFITTKALVLREVRYKEADRMLTLFTSSDGRISAKAGGALRKSSKMAAGTQQLTYSELTIFQNKGKWNVNEASVIEPFDGLRRDISAFALGSYFAECIEALSVEDEPDPPLLQLGLNSLFALSRGLYPTELIKTAFELRLMSLSGYEPDISGCVVCGKSETEEPMLAVESGGLCCRKCRSGVSGEAYPLSPETVKAMTYILTAPAKQIFSFSIKGEELEKLSRASEAYILAKTERSFGTLNYWKKVR